MEEIEAAYARWDKERREGIRVPLQLEVRWEGLDGKRLAYTRDIGKGGCFMESAQTMPVGTRFIFEVKTPTGRCMRLFGEVIYALPDAGFGVRFKLLTEADRNALALLIEYAKEAGGAD